MLAPTRILYVSPIKVWEARLKQDLTLPIGSLAIFGKFLRRKYDESARLNLHIGSLAILEKFLRFNPNQLANPNLGGWLFNPKHGDEDAKPARESKSRRLAI